MASPSQGQQLPPPHLPAAASIASPSPGASEIGQPKPAMLAWWGIFPVIAFAAAHFTLKWEMAHASASAPQYAISYLAGGFVGGLLVAGLAGWIAYRVGRRSQVAGALAFTVILSLVVLNDIASGVFVKSIVKPPSKAAAVAKFGEFRFEIPAGWVRVQPDKDKTKAMLMLNPGPAGTPDGIIMVDVGKPVTPTARGMAGLFAGNDGQVMSAPVFLDGIEGTRVETPSRDTTRPRFGVIVMRGGEVYLVMAAEAHEVDVSAAFNHVLQTWHWSRAAQ